jgi:hypothetical protein
MNKEFGELAVGDRFILNGSEFVKTGEVRVSCCKSVNCQSVNNPAETTFVQVNTVVTVNG